MARPDEWLAGVDGCPAGWLVIFSRPDGEILPPRILSRFADIIAAPESPTLIAVDMPIGMPDFSELRGRAPERLLRPQMGPRASSIFRIPSRRAVYASVEPSIPDDKARFIRACAIARETSVDGKAFAKQGFYLCQKIVELDKLLRTQKYLAECVFETHPEVAFWKLNKERPLTEPKKRKGRPHEPGLQLRRQLLMKEGIPNKLATSCAPKGAGADDLLDALVCTIIARRIYANHARAHPAEWTRDAFGLPMAIWA